jgi:hypothetical protein
MLRKEGIEENWRDLLKDHNRCAVAEERHDNLQSL